MSGRAFESEEFAAGFAGFDDAVGKERQFRVFGEPRKSGGASTGRAGASVW
jgi:hypothetical protein